MGLRSFLVVMPVVEACPDLFTWLRDHVPMWGPNLLEMNPNEK